MSEIELYLLEQIRSGHIPKARAVQLLKQLITLKSANPSSFVRTVFEPIAVIGMGCNFPGAPNIKEFWSLLVKGEDAIREIDRWITDDTFFGTTGKKKTSVSKWGGFLDRLDLFDYGFFDITQHQADSMDPQQRLFLEVAWNALEDGGYAGRREGSNRIGVFVGARASNYKTKPHDVDDSPNSGEQYRDTLIGQAQNFIAAWVSHCLNLTGPSLVVDTACSSSLISIHLACQSLRNGECDMAIAGGVDILISPEVYISLSQAGALSPDGKCFTFDRKANGYVPGEGAGAVLLKPLSAALKDGDRIYGIIRGSAINNDARTMGVTTPNLEAQKRVLEEAYQRAGVTPDRVTYIEAHGTGTTIGDPIEIKALSEVFGRYTSKKQFCAIGSVKTNIGHLHSAAGVAGFIKTVLSLHHRYLPRTLNCTEPNPRLQFHNTPFYPKLEGGDWENDKSPRYAGISSFGFGGTNCHVVLEEAPSADEKHPVLSHYVLTLSARSKPALLERVKQWYTHLEETSGWTVGDVCRSANIGRGDFAHRLSYVVSSEADLMEQLRETIRRGLDEAESAAFYAEIKRGKRVKTAFSFTGQGAQYAGMGRELYQTLPIFKKHMDACAAALDTHLDIPLLQLLYEREDGRLQETRYTQPVTFAIEYALARTWMELGVKPDIMIGHSVGEYAAACIGGGFSLEDAGRLIVVRARLMQERCRRGKMVAVFAEASRIEKELGEARDSVSIAAINGERQIVVSGESDRIRELTAAWTARGIRVVELQVSHAFHSPMMEPMIAEYARELQTVPYQDLQIPIVSNVTGKPVQRMDAEYWLKQVTKPVLFSAGIEYLRTERCDIVLEVGPSSTLTAMTKQAMGREACLLLHSLQKGQSDWRSLSHVLSKLYLMGVTEPVERISARYGKRIWLPTYPFERQKCWSQDRGSETGNAVNQKAETVHLTKHSVEYPYFDRCVAQEGNLAVFEKILRSSDMVMQDHTVKGQYIIPGVTWLEMTATALKRLGYTAYVFENVTFNTPLQCIPGQITTARLEVTIDGRIARFSGLGKIGADGEWSKHIHGTVKLDHLALEESGELDFKAIKSRCTTVIPAEQIYQRIRNTQIVHGPYYRSLQDARTNENEVLVTLRLTDVARKYNDLMILHPALLDASTTAGNALARYVEWFETGEGRTYIPFHIDRVEVFGKLPAEVVCHFERISETIEIISYRIKLADMSGKVLLRINKFSCKRIPETADFLTKKIHSGQIEQDYLGRLVWVKQDVPIAHLEELSRVRIIFLDENGIGANIVNALMDLPGETMIVSPGIKFQVAGNRFRINPKNADDYTQFVRVLQSRGIEIGQVIHLWSTNCGPETVQRADDVMEHQYFGVYSLFFLFKAFHQCHKFPRFSLKVVASNMIQLNPGEVCWGVPSATLIGFVKSLTHEYPHVKAELIDVNRDRMSVAEIANAILARLSYEPVAPLVALRKGEVWTQKIVKVDETAVDQSPSRKSRKGGVYLVTGGTGGIGLELTRALSKHFAPGSKFVLLNRSPFPPREKWKEIIRLAGDTDPLVEKLRIIEEIEQESSETITLQVDITKEKDLDEALRFIRERYGPINGVVHAAGTHKDSLVVNKNELDMKRVLEAKVKGTIILDQLTRQDPLEFFVICSSVASIFGGVGQSDYSAANSFVDQYTHYRNGMVQRRTLTLNWSLWHNVGMARSSEATSGLVRMGLRPLNRHMASNLFLKTLFLPYEQIIIEDQILKCRGITHLGGKNKQSKSQSSDGSPKFSVKEAVLTARTVEEFVIRQISEFSEVREIDPDMEFLTLGLESAHIIKLSEMIGDKLGITLYPTLLFEHPSPRKLAAYLLETCREALQELFCAGAQLEVQKPVAPLVGAVPETAFQLYLKGQVAAVIGKTPEEIDLETDFISLGLTSADIVELSGKLSAELNAELYPTLLFEHVNIAALSRHLSETMEYVPALLAVTGTEQTTSSEEADASAGYSRDEDIAIIGFHGRFPGSDDPESFWEGLLQNRDEVKEVTRFQIPNPSGVRMRAGMLDKVDEFDPYFFKISPKEAREMDPQQRLLLEGTWELFERAGYSYSSLNGTRTGVFIGVMNSDYLHEAIKFGKSLGVGSGVSPAILANRISYFYNFKGPSMPVETACSSSLVAVHLACQSLRLGESEMAVAGGVNVLLSPDYFIEFDKNGMLSKDGKCKAFDKSADGYVRGEGMGLVLLKPLSAAIRDRDRIYAVIKGSAVNHDGKTNGLSAPSPQAQADVIKRAYEVSGVHPETVTYIEAHGTGTPLGDPIEFEGLIRAFRTFTDKKQFCALGTVKTNIGHLESAAGVAGLIKIILMFKHRMMPKSLHLNEINPMIDAENSPFYFLTENRRWDGERPRRAGISSFGYGGLNCHVVLEEFQESALPDSAGKLEKPELFLLSAYTEEALRKQVKRFETYVAEHPDIALSDICYTLLTGRELLPFIIVIAVKDREDLISKLRICSQVGRLHQVEHPDICFIDKKGDVSRIIDDFQKKSATFAMVSEVVKRVINAIRHRNMEELAALKVWLSGRPVILPTYPFERESYWLEAVVPTMEKPAEDEPPAEEASSHCQDMLYVAEWHAKPGDDLKSDGNGSEPLILISESADLSEKLSRLMEQKGRSCVVISMADDNWAAAAEEQFRQRKISTVIFAGSLESNGFGRSEQRTTLENFLKAAKLLKHSKEPVSLLVVLFDGHMVTGKEEKLDPLMSALWSMAIVVQQEYKHVTVRGIDVSSDESMEQVSFCIGMELERKPSGRLVAYRDGERWEQEFVRIHQPEKRRRFDTEGKVFWITGGLGDIGLSLAAYLAEKGRCTVYLTGRMPLPDRAKWDEWLFHHGEDDPTSRKILAIRSIERSGSKIELAPGDVTNFAEMSSVMQRIESESGRLDGVFHLAGIAGKGKPIYKLEPVDLHETLAPKMVGIQVLDRVTREIELELFVAYSSISAIVGGIGMLDYSAANGYLSAYAQRQRYLGKKPFVAVEWPLFKEIGMGTRTSYFTGKNGRENAITVSEANRLLEAILEDNRPYYLVSKNRNFNPADSEEAAEESDPAAKISGSGGEARGYELTALEQPLIRELIQLVAKIIEAPEVKIPPNALFNDLGIDSQMRLQMLESLEDRFSIDLPLTLFTDYPTLIDVNRYLLQYHQEAIVAAMDNIVPL